MGLIKNFDSLATSEQRKKALEIVEAGLEAIQPNQVLSSQFTVHGKDLQIKGKTFDLSSFERVFLVGFGKGSSGVAKYLENILGDTLTEGWDIDVVDETFNKLHYTKGTHPLPLKK